MNLKFTETVAITSGNSATVNVTSASEHYRIVVMGAGSGTVQPTINSSADHEAYVISDTTRLLDLTGVESFEITAAGGDITAIVTGYKL